MSKKKRPFKKYQEPSDYYKDYMDWPNTWTVGHEDLHIANNLRNHFTPFIQSMIADGLAVKTIKNHMLNLSQLALEIIGRLNDEDEGNRKLPIETLLLKYIDDQNGPLLHHLDPNDSADEVQLKAFDSTCRKLYKYNLLAF